MNRCCLNGNSLSVIQGDTLDVTVEIENPEELVITRVVFSCPSLDIKKELTPLNENDSLGGFVLSSEETMHLNVGDWEFNVQAISDTGEVFTILFKRRLHVEYNRSKEVGPVPPYEIKGMGWTED